MRLWTHAVFLFCCCVYALSIPVNAGVLNAIANTKGYNEEVFLRQKREEEDESEEDHEDDDNFNEHIDIPLSPSDRNTFVDEMDKGQNVIGSPIKKTYSCPRIKTDLKTGTNVGDLSPEDISIIAAMGDALATGAGLWPKTDIEFRGAAFPSGGDATIDGLVTIPNILREFNPAISGVSHGMGTADQLPEHQLNVAESGATSRSLLWQAKELVRRLKLLKEAEYETNWVMIIITIGTEEVCRGRGPNAEFLREALEELQLGIPKAFVVLLGPLHVSNATDQRYNLLGEKCGLKHSALNQLTQEWVDALALAQRRINDNEMKRPTFEVLAIRQLTITSRYPMGLFLSTKPLLNRRGHNYATKWLWNRLLAGEKYNLTTAVLSQDNYLCPSTGCPYFRTSANVHGCQLLSLSESKDKELQLSDDGKVIKKPRRTRKRLYTIAIVIVGLAFFVVCTLGTVFYQKSKQGTHGRFEVIEESQLKFEETKKEEEKALLTRQNTRALSVDPGLRASQNASIRRLNSECERDS